MKKKSDEYMVLVVKGENRVNVGKQTFANGGVHIKSFYAL